MSLLELYLNYEIFENIPIFCKSVNSILKIFHKTFVLILLNVMLLIIFFYNERLLLFVIWIQHIGHIQQQS